MSFTVTDATEKNSVLGPLLKIDGTNQENLPPAIKSAVYRVLSRNNAVGVISGCYRDGLPIAHISEFMLAMLGYPDTDDFFQSTGGLLTALIHPDDRASFTVERFTDCECSMTYRIIRSDGTALWVSQEKDETEDDDGSAMWVISLRNIEEQIQMTEHLSTCSRALKDSYSSSNKARRDKNRFLADMSHDIRTPLNDIIGMTAVAATHIQDVDRISDCLSKIAISGQSLVHLLDDIVDMTRIESGIFELKSEPLNVMYVVNGVIDRCLSAAEAKSQTIELNQRDIRHRFVISDGQRLAQLLDIFLSNACRYTPKGGKITISVAEKNTNRQRIGCYEFTITDTGIGIAEDFLPHIFEPFARANDPRVSNTHGTGLGLPIAKNIIEMMNGSISVESVPEIGTTFVVTVFLPIDEGAAAIDDVSASEPDAAQSIVQFTPADDTELPATDTVDFTGKRGLLVEDNELNAEIAIEILSMVGLELDLVSNGREAVERMSVIPAGYYDIILMDIQMPVMNGYDATLAIRAMNSSYAQKVPIVAMTASIFAEDIAAAKAAGMNDHIAKPLEFERISEVLGKLLR